MSNTSKTKILRDIWRWIISALILPVSGFGINLYVDFLDIKKSVETLEKNLNEMAEKSLNTNTKVDLVEMRGEINLIKSRIKNNKEDIKELKKGK